MTLCLKILLVLLTIAATSMNTVGFCQSNSIPSSVSNNFNSMCPRATKIKWGGDKSTEFHVYYLLDSTQCESKFNPDGQWMSTEMKLKKDSLPPEIKNGLRSSAYAKWAIQSAFVVYFPGQITHYRIVVTYEDSPKKIVSFDQTGQLIKDNFSL
jgi:hypothetical protein